MTGSNRKAPGPRRRAVRDTSTPDKKAFWDGVKEAADAMKGRPDYERAGINLNPEHFETYEPECESCSGTGWMDAPMHSVEKLITRSGDGIGVYVCLACKGTRGRAGRR